MYTGLGSLRFKGLGFRVDGLGYKIWKPESRTIVRIPETLNPKPRGKFNGKLGLCRVHRDAGA